MHTVIAKPTHYEASIDPIGDLDMVAYPGQDPKRRMYQQGFEQFFNNLPIVKTEKDLVEATTVMSTLAEILASQKWFLKNDPGKGKFWRTIIGMESPYMMPEETDLKEGVEILVAHWGKDFTSPIHGHAAGFLYEHMISGKLRVNTYRLVDVKNGIVRPVETVVYEGTEQIAAALTQPGKHFHREGYIHSFTAIETTHSLHFVPEHTRDGRDNTFKVEYFEDHIGLPILEEQIHRIEMPEAITMPIGSVVLVRSDMVPQYGDHYMIVVGPQMKKAWGDNIPADKAIYAPGISSILDKYPKHNGRTILKLSNQALAAFHEFHDIKVVGKEVIFPEASKLLV